MRDLTFTPDQIHRYSRHILLPDVGGLGQSRLLAATITLDISGPSARIAAAYLAAAGIGTLLLSGPPRALTAADLLFPFSPSDLGHPLVSTLITRLSALNPDVRVSEYRTDDTSIVGSSAGRSANSVDGGARSVPVLSENRTDDTRSDTRIEVGEADDGLAGAMARGGEAAARVVWRIAVGRP
jgi:hypothetical protein